jgi:hypothetical protein
MNMDELAAFYRRIAIEVEHWPVRMRFLNQK